MRSRDAAAPAIPEEPAAPAAPEESATGAGAVQAAIAAARQGNGASRWPDRVPVPERLAVLLDPGSWREDGLLANAASDGPPADGVRTGGSFFEIKAPWAQEIVVGLARLDGRVVGIVAAHCISTPEIEAIATAHPQVAEAAVVGVCRWNPCPAESASAPRA